MTMMTRALSILLAVAASARADNLIAGDPSPAPKPIVIAPPPPPAPRVRPLLGDRWTLSAETGVGWLQLGGALGGGMLVQPALTRTFDRLEVSATYTAMDWVDATQMHPSGTVHRLGAAAHYQLGRVRVERKMTLDLVGTAGAGVQHVVPERGRSRDRPDVSLGVVLRTLTDLDDRTGSRLFFGMELGAQLLLVPRRDGEVDLGVMIAFGVPIGW